jgi:hypothetical protein
MIPKIEYDIPNYFRDFDKTKNDIEKIINDVLPIISDFYKKFDVLVDVVSVKPHARDWSTKIEFISNSGKPYCFIYIYTTQLGSAFLTPSKRKWEIVLIFKNESVDVQNKLYLEHGLSCLNIHHSKEKTNGGIGSLYDSIGKIRDAIQTNEQWVDEYYSGIKKFQNEEK